MKINLIVFIIATSMLILHGSSHFVFAQTKSVTDLAILSQSIAELDQFLNNVLEEDPVIQELNFLVKKQLSKSDASHKMPNPELSINYSPVPMQRALNQTVAFRGMQRVWWPGSISNVVESERFLSEERSLIVLHQTNDRLIKAAQKWFDYWLISQQKNIYSEHMKFLKSGIKNEQTRIEHSGNQIRFIEFEMELLELTNMLERFQQAEASALAEFKAFGVDFDTYTISDSVHITMDLKKPIWSEHPLAQASELRAKSYELKGESAKKEGLPMLALGAEYMLIDEAMTIMAPEMQMRNSLMLMATVSVPLFRRQYKGRIEEFDLSRNEALYQRNSIEIQLQRDFEVLENKQNQLKKELILYGETLPSKIDQLIVLQEQVMKTSSSASLQTWLQLQRRKLSLQEKYIQTLTEIHKTQVAYLLLAPFN